MQDQAPTNLRGGSIETVIDWIIEKNGDMEITDKFLASFPQVIAAETIWKIVEAKMKRLLNKQDIRGDSWGPKDRVSSFLWRWIDKDLTRDFLRGKNKPMFEALLSLVDGMDKQSANEYKLLLIRSAFRRHRREKYLKLRSLSVGKSSDAPATPPSEADSANPSPKFTLKQSPNPAKLLSDSSRTSHLSASHLGSPPAEFIDFPEREVAEQLTQIEWNIFSRIQDSEFHHSNWKKAENKLARNVCSMVERFNTVSYWVATEIVMQTDLRKRITLMRKFVTIAENMREIGNYNGLMEIIGGLNSMPVQRLKATWEQVPKSIVDSFQQLNALMDHINNYASYRKILSLSKGPVLPYLGVYLRDVIFLDEGNSNYLDKEKSQINLDKLLLLGSTFCEVRRFQQNPFPFVENWMKNHLEKLFVLPEEMLYKHSLLCENNPGQQE